MARNATDVSSDVVTAVTLVIGTALLGAPRRTAAVLALGTGSIATRAIGAADVVVGCGLASGQLRWPWMAARSVLNLVLAAVYLRLRHNPGVGHRARRGAIVMASLTLVDATLAARLRARDR